jgi:aryl-alcohol dehydrogenase-like predicted oxidoreductase
MTAHAPIPGQATPEGTRRRFARLDPRFRGRTLGPTELAVSPAGFGGYRTGTEFAEHAEALRAALRGGINLIDTSANYGDGDSERLAGRVLRELIEDGELARDEVVVITKAGYVQGANLNLARAREAEGRPFPEMNRLGPDLWHCISPEFLADQLDRSLERLGLERVDVLLLHNPEYYLKAAGDHAEYYRRIGRAFAHLEQEARRGRIGWFGVSSNTLPVEREDDDFTSLEILLDLARETGARRFGVIQFPFNLLEPGAALSEHGARRTLLELAREAGLGTLANRPLNAFAGDRLVRLADFPATDELDLPGTVRARIEALTAIETRYPAREVVPAREIAWGHILAHHLDQVTDLSMWRHVRRHQIAPSLEANLPRVARVAPEWASEFRRGADALFTSIETLLAAQASQQVEPIRAALEREAPGLRASGRLSRQALRVYRSWPGLDVTLVGMRTSEYVSDVLAGLADPELTPDEAHAALEAAVGAWLESPAGRGPTTP